MAASRQPRTQRRKSRAIARVFDNPWGAANQQASTFLRGNRIWGFSHPAAATRAAILASVSDGANCEPTIRQQFLDSARSCSSQSPWVSLVLSALTPRPSSACSDLDAVLRNVSLTMLSPVSAQVNASFAKLWKCRDKFRIEAVLTALQPQEAMFVPEATWTSTAISCVGPYVALGPHADFECNFRDERMFGDVKHLTPHAPIHTPERRTPAAFSLSARVIDVGNVLRRSGYPQPLSGTSSQLGFALRKSQERESGNHITSAESPTSPNQNVSVEMTTRVSNASKPEPAESQHILPSEVIRQQLQHLSMDVGPDSECTERQDSTPEVKIPKQGASQSQRRLIRARRVELSTSNIDMALETPNDIDTEQILPPQDLSTMLTASCAERGYRDDSSSDSVFDARMADESETLNNIQVASMNDVGQVQAARNVFGMYTHAQSPPRSSGSIECTLQLQAIRSLTQRESPDNLKEAMNVIGPLIKNSENQNRFATYTDAAGASDMPPQIAETSSSESSESDDFEIVRYDRREVLRKLTGVATLSADVDVTDNFRDHDAHMGRVLRDQGNVLIQEGSDAWLLIRAFFRDEQRVLRRASAKEFEFALQEPRWDPSQKCYCHLKIVLSATPTEEGILKGNCRVIMVRPRQRRKVSTTTASS